MGKVICMLDRYSVQKQAPEDLHFEAGLKVCNVYITQYVPASTPPVLCGNTIKVPQAVCKRFVRCLCGDVINLCLRSIVPGRTQMDLMKLYGVRMG